MKVIKDNKGRLMIQLPKLSKTQQQILKSLSVQNISNYISSFTGNRQDIYIIRRKRRLSKESIDPLKAKGANYYLEQLNSMFDTSKLHKPGVKDAGKWVGVEIECFIPRSSFPSITGGCEGCEDNCDCDNPFHDCEECTSIHESASEEDYHEALSEYLNKHKIKYCSVKRDRSISEDNGYFPVELTIVFHKDKPEYLQKLCATLNSLGAKVNASCGMHVHLDQRDLINNSLKAGYKVTSLEKRAQRLGLALPLLFKMVPGSRRDNSYCKSGVSTLTGDRYSAVNLTAFYKFKTIEIRIHSATTDYVKISNWINLLHLIQSSIIERNIDTLDKLLEDVNVPEYLIEYIEKRTEKFKDKDTPEDRVSNYTGEVLTSGLVTLIPVPGQSIYPQISNEAFWGSSNNIIMYDVEEEGA